jgi:hypothetical protein
LGVPQQERVYPIGARWHILSILSICITFNSDAYYKILGAVSKITPRA